MQNKHYPVSNSPILCLSVNVVMVTTRKVLAQFWPMIPYYLVSRSSKIALMIVQVNITKPNLPD